MTTHWIIYDGNCNLCSTLVQGLEQIDQGKRFQYVAMQEAETLAQWQITPTDCERGMILMQQSDPSQRWQGSAAAEEIARLLPAGELLIAAYRAIPGLKWAGDRGYEQVRDHRYDWFGRRQAVYHSAYPADPCPTCHP